MRFFDRFKKASRPRGADQKDIGHDVIEFLFSSLGIDTEWSVREPRGFTWWGHQLAQRVWAEPPAESHGFAVVRCHAETAVLKNVSPSTQFAARLGALNHCASLSAYVWHPDSRRVTLRCSVLLHEDNVEWAKRLLLAATGIQAADAHIKLGLAETLQGEPDSSEHPKSGRRQEPDPVLDIIQTTFAPEGQGSSSFTDDDFSRVLAMEPAPWVLANEGDLGLTAEFPFTGARPAAELAFRGEDNVETALLTVKATERHPQLGSGALVQLSLPLTLPAADAAELAARLNRVEAEESPDSALCLGAWCPDRSDGICFVTFLPSAIRRPGLLNVVVLDAGLRTRWVEGYLRRHGLLAQEGDPR